MTPVELSMRENLPFLMSKTLMFFPTVSETYIRPFLAATAYGLESPVAVSPDSEAASLPARMSKKETSFGFSLTPATYLPSTSAELLMVLSY